MSAHRATVFIPDTTPALVYCSLVGFIYEEKVRETAPAHSIGENVLDASNHVTQAEHTRLEFLKKTLTTLLLLLPELDSNF